MTRARSDAAALAEPALRSPRQLALALPLVALIGLALVTLAAMAGVSARGVALVAVGGFTLCAVAPMALIERCVGRPMRVALEQLRAARDGRPAPEGAPRASGVVGDLVAVAQDICASQLKQRRLGDAFNQCDKMIEAGDEAIAAFRRQADELAASASLGETRQRRAAQAQMAELVEAITALRAAPPAESGERVEAMLVYLAEALDRIEGKEKEAGGALVRVEKSCAELARLVARDSEALRTGVGNAAQAARNDFAAAAAEGARGRSWQAERLETLETRLLARLDGLAAPDSERLAEAIRAESMTTRLALRDRIDQALKPLTEAADEHIRLENVAAELRRSADDMAQRVAVLDAFSQRALPATEAALQAAGRRLDAAAEAIGRPAQYSPASSSEELAAQGAALHQTMAALAARFDTFAEMRDDGRALDRPSFAAALTVFRNMTRQLSQAVQRVQDVGARGPAAVDADAASGVVARLDLRFDGFAETHAKRLEALEMRLVGRNASLDRTAVASALTVLRGLQRDLGAAVDRFNQATGLIEARAQALGGGAATNESGRPPTLAVIDNSDRVFIRA